MSELSVREVNAGISRRAIDTLQSSFNGRKPAAKPKVPKVVEPPGESGSLEQHLAAAKKYRIEAPEKISVVDIWDRQLDVLNIDGWNFRIRDVHHTGRLQVDTISLDRVELEALGNRIRRILGEMGAK